MRWETKEPGRTLGRKGEGDLLVDDAAASGKQGRWSSGQHGAERAGGGWEKVGR